MLDFMKVQHRRVKTGIEVFPKFIIKSKHDDLMIRGGDFYAIWDEKAGLWSTDEGDAIRMIDKLIDDYIEKNKTIFEGSEVFPMYMCDADTGTIDKWHKYCQKQQRDSYTVLDEKLIFSNDTVNKKDYSSKRLAYALEPGSIESWDKIISTLYSPEERHKIEWAIGSIVTGDSRHIQKFMVLYGAAGTGKSTILNIIQKLFEGYYSVFDAKALGQSSNSFALESFRSNPLVAIQHDGDLSRIEDNTRLNSLVSHEQMTINEKFKSTYTNRFKCFLFMGTNRPVKITDGKSGLLRRLIDVTPSGIKLGASEYKRLTKNVLFELGAIAHHCSQVYLEDPRYYDDYIPVSMMGASNDFYNYILDYYSSFLKEDGVSLNVAWERYKTYCDDANVPSVAILSRMRFKEELKNYFWEFNDRFTREDGTRVRSYYSGFRVDKFETEKKPGGKIEKNIPSWIELKEQESIFDKEYANCIAQYASTKETPSKKWEQVHTTLESLDTKLVHYVLLPENHIVIDFDLKNEKGEKDSALNIAAASNWPATYAELSKGGGGLHLHYIYTGDVSKLSRVYNDGIEIKVFTGNSSLRRRLSKCNDIPIATISGGLPLKEEKMINNDIVQTEKGLRTTIKKCLNKEIHAGTKPNVDFIFKILEEAYDSGIHYDVTDMQNEIFAFAANSTHQADTCIKLANKMHFKSDEQSDCEEYDAPIVFYDIEVFPNLFLVNWKFAGEDKPVVRMINPDAKAIEDLMKFKLIGFNCRRYDNHILYARMMGYTNEEIYRLSTKIISGERNALFGEAYNVSYTDVYDFASAGNKKSLKKLEIEMGIHHQELGLPWDQPVDESLWIKVAEYCDNDVIATEAAFNYLSADWTARQILADLAGMTVNDTTNTLTTRIIFGSNRKPQSEFHYRDLSKPVSADDIDEETYEFLAGKFPEMMAQTHGEAGSLLPYFDGYIYEFGKSTYRGEVVGEGGFAEGLPGMYYNVALLDVASMHPHSVIAECLFGVRYTKAFDDIVVGRVSIKHDAWDEVNGMLDGKLTKHVQRVIDGELTSKNLADGLKTAINSVYGLTSASFENPFRDIRNKDNIVAKRGALFMLDLRQAVRERGFTVAHIKTDSIKIPDATPEIIQFVMEFGLRYGYTFEHEATYDRMCLVNDAVYIAKYLEPNACEELYGYIPGDNYKHGGEWTATGQQFAVPYLFKTLFSHEPIEFRDMCETFSVAKGDLYLDMNEKIEQMSPEDTKELEVLGKAWTSQDPLALEKAAKKYGYDFDHLGERYSELCEMEKATHDMHFVGRVGQFCPIKPDWGGGVLYRVNEGKNYAASGSKGFRWLESETVSSAGMEDIIDRSFYTKLIDEAIEVISEYGDFEMFVG